MRTEDSAQAEDGATVKRTSIRARIAREPEFVRTIRGIGICRLMVIGEAGPASSPPQAFLYIRDGGPLRVDEAVRCGLGLHEGDLIEAVGKVGAMRRKARHQEVIVTERVKLRQRAAGAA
jgi:hypothetical protein